MHPEEQHSELILQRLELYGVRLGLERMQRLLRALGGPQLSIPTVIVAGTNGKGSTSALLASMCQTAGYRTGLYTSPHLETVHERVRIGGRAIAEPALAEYLARAIALAAELRDEPPTYFEAMTLAAWQCFRDERVDLAVLEVGLGGRLDATNASEPKLAVITQIAHDHEDQLGSTLASIAREKAGVMRPEQPVIAWGEHEEVRATLEREAASIGARLTFATDHVRLQGLTETERGQQIELATPSRAYVVDLPLLGRHQWANLALATLAAETLAGQGFPNLGPRAIASGAAACRWPGRLEWITLPDGRMVLLDVAHNPDGIEALAAYLERLATRIDLLFGAFADKRVERMLPRIAGLAEDLVMTSPPGARASDPNSWLPLLGERRATVEPDVSRALERALGSGERPLVVCGSLYLVGLVRGLLRERFGVPEPALEAGTG
ncbi:MAG: bifunctional folylpolyglutamate synthase/dihydrofolate synthase [Thermoanaerobaculia bacterium]|nr:bifunctional folylpolyglutamate synthase/dihydrofolate synthase [Thermoanaerobaculia bacterium]